MPRLRGGALRRGRRDRLSGPTALACVDELLAEARRRGMDHVDVIYEAGQGGPQAFFDRVGFTPVGETEYGEVIAEIGL